MAGNWWKTTAGPQRSPANKQVHPPGPRACPCQRPALSRLDRLKATWGTRPSGHGLPPRASCVRGAVAGAGGSHAVTVGPPASVPLGRGALHPSVRGRWPTGRRTSCHVSGCGLSGTKRTRRRGRRRPEAGLALEGSGPREHPLDCQGRLPQALLFTPVLSSLPHAGPPDGGPERCQDSAGEGQVVLCQEAA